MHDLKKQIQTNDPWGDIIGHQTTARLLPLTITPWAWQSSLISVHLTGLLTGLYFTSLILRMLQAAVESLAQAKINYIHCLPLSTELHMSSWKAIRLIQHYYPFGSSWQLLTKMFLYFVCLVMFAKIIYSISIPRDKMRVTGFEPFWILFPDGNDISSKLSPSDCPDLSKVECDLVMTLASQHLLNLTGSPGFVLVQWVPNLIFLHQG